MPGQYPGGLNGSARWIERRYAFLIIAEQCRYQAPCAARRVVPWSARRQTGQEAVRFLLRQYPTTPRLISGAEANNHEQPQGVGAVLVDVIDCGPRPLFFDLDYLSIRQSSTG